jgi:hypothetical protein
MDPNPAAMEEIMDLAMETTEVAMVLDLELVVLAMVEATAVLIVEATITRNSLIV